MHSGEASQSRPRPHRRYLWRSCLAIGGCRWPSKYVPGGRVQGVRLGRASEDGGPAVISCLRPSTLSPLLPVPPMGRGARLGGDWSAATCRLRRAADEGRSASSSRTRHAPGPSKARSCSDKADAFIIGSDPWPTSPAAGGPNPTRPGHWSSYSKYGLSKTSPGGQTSPAPSRRRSGCPSASRFGLCN